MQQNKQPRSDEHQTKRLEMCYDWDRCWLIDAYYLADKGNGSVVSGSARASVAALPARVAKKILPFGKEEPQADLQKVEIFFKPLACPCRHVL